jgi:hypothetical protein
MLRLATVTKFRNNPSPFKSKVFLGEVSADGTVRYKSREKAECRSFLLRMGLDPRRNDQFVGNGFVAQVVEYDGEFHAVVEKFHGRA